MTSQREEEESHLVSEGMQQIQTEPLDAEALFSRHTMANEDNASVKSALHAGKGGPNERAVTAIQLGAKHPMAGDMFLPYHLRKCRQRGAQESQTQVDYGKL